MSISRRAFLGLGATAAAACAPSPPRCSPRSPSDTLPAFEGKIEHFIVLMMENRSYDQMLGALSGPEHDGLPEGAQLSFEDRDGVERSVPVLKGAPPDRFSPDPGHNFAAVAAQIHGAGRGAAADMGGFARRFVQDHPSVTREAMQRYATIYADGRLPVLQTLAKEYGVCSHWFCSLPSSTTPNRMFAHAGTSRGATRQGAYYARVEGRMIFDLLAPRDYRVYFHDVPHLWLTGDAWTAALAGQFHHMASFARDVRDDALPTYAFLEPQHVLPPWSSQHPSAGVSHGEKLIAHVYDTLVSNPCVFEKSLLLVVYDEHGGFYDHVVPPGHEGWNRGRPDLHHEVVSPDDERGEGDERGYEFTTLGPRVPAVVVSPWIERGSVFGWNARDPARRVTFDHTSILATVGCMTNAWVESHRVRAAETLGVTINRETPRRDYPLRVPYRESDYASDGIAEVDSNVGVASDVCAAFVERHGPASPSEIVAHYAKLVGR